MDGVKPTGILTDQCASIEAGIRHVLGPDTVHRYCSWHILHKLSSKWRFVSDKAKDKKGKSDKVQPNKVNVKSDKVQEKKNEKSGKVKEVVYKSKTKQEFEEKWLKLMEELGKQNDPWFRGIFALREKWVPVYLNGQFWAGMTSTQRVESMNHFLNSYLTKRESLKEFVENFEISLKSIWQNKNAADHKSKFKIPMTHYELPMEAQLQRCYTNDIFYKCQQQFRKCVSLSCKLVE